METHGPLGTIWVSLGLISFYLALVWINLVVLPLIITALLMLPGTHLLDKKPKQTSS